MEKNRADVAFGDIQQEFNETFGYVRQDIAAIRKADLGLNYTVALLICCACEMLAWHKGKTKVEVFASLLPDDYKAMGKKLWECLRNGLAHNFRPDTLRTSKGDWRFQLAKEGVQAVMIFGKNPKWLRLNTKFLEERLFADIDAYEQELRRDAGARAKFIHKSQRSVKEVPGEPKDIVAWSSLANG